MIQKYFNEEDFITIKAILDIHENCICTITKTLGFNRFKIYNNKMTDILLYASENTLVIQNMSLTELSKKIARNLPL